MGILAGVVVGVLAAIALLAFAGGPRDGLLTPTVPSETIVATASPSASPTPTASPLATPSLAGRALVALEEVDAAIANTGGSGGLKGKDRNELLRLATVVRQALDSGDIDRARRAADDLAKKVASVAKDLDKTRANRLQNAVAALRQILSEG